MNARSPDLASDTPTTPPTPSVSLDFELPIDPLHRSIPPEGNWESGYWLSVSALELVRDRPEVFEERARLMVDVEFVL